MDEPIKEEKTSVDAVAGDHATETSGRAHIPDAQALADFEKEGMKDARGDTFDPTIHRLDKKGEPDTSPKGFFRKLGKDKSTKTTTRSTLHDPKAQESEEKATAQAYAQARLLTLMVTGTCANLMGKEWEPTEQEQVFLEQCTGEAFDTWGWTDLPPGWAFAIGWGQYAIPRLIKEKKKGTFTKLKEKIWPKKKEDKKDAHSDTGPDRDRKDASK